MRSGLFESYYYLSTYRDVRMADINPLMHYIKFGWKEGRNPSRDFNTQEYLKLHPDVKAAGINPLLHHISHGIKEDRMLCRTTSELVYKDYDDLSSSKIRNQYRQYFSTFPPNSDDIIIFPILDWDFRFQRPQQLARQLAGLGHRVFYLKAGEHYRDNKAPLIKKIEENLFSVHLIGGEEHIPFESTLTEDNVKDLEASFNHLVKTFLIKSAIIKVDLPIWQKLALQLRDSYGWKLVYDCMDLHSGFSSSNKNKIQDEETLLKKCDVVLASSNHLLNFVKQYNDHALFIPNAADYDFFHQAANQMDVAEISDISRPIIGYYGAISDWFDTELIGELASKHPEWNFILIGGTSTADLKPISNHKNIYLFGEKPYNDIPTFLSNFDVCIIPFKKMPLTEATNPVKLFEYLAAGKPVVATKLDEISNYKEYILLAETTIEWETAIKISLAENKTKELMNKRFNFAKANTWEARTSHILKNLLMHDSD